MISNESELLIDATALRKSFGAQKTDDEVHVLRGVSIQVPRGKTVAIIGPSGCGKSTLLYCLAGLEKPDSGTVTVAGLSTEGLSRTQLARLYRDRCGFVFQTSNLISSLSSVENVVVTDRLKRKKPDLARALLLLDSLGIGAKAGILPTYLSTGQQQRVAMARVLYSRPELVFADEPTGALDSEQGQVVLSALNTYPENTRSVLMVTHDLEAAAGADIVMVMRDGRIESTLFDPTESTVRQAFLGNL